MKFRVESAFTGITLPEYEALFFDESFNNAMCASVKLARQLIKRDITNGQLKRATKIGADREVPAPVAKLIGTAKLEYTEHLDYKFGGYLASWRTEPSIMVDKIRAQGRIGFEQRGNRVIRWVDGDIEVKMFGVGGVIEKFIVSDVEKSYQRAAEFTQRWINEKGPKVQA
jgi:hypothetical protein